MRTTHTEAHTPTASSTTTDGMVTPRGRRAQRARGEDTRADQCPIAMGPGGRLVRHPKRGPLAAAVLRVLRPSHVAPTRRSIRPRNGRTYPVDHTPVHAQSARHGRRITRQHRAGRASVVALIAAASVGAALGVPRYLRANSLFEAGSLTEVAGAITRRLTPSRDRGAAARPPDLPSDQHGRWNADRRRRASSADRRGTAALTCNQTFSPCGDTLRLPPGGSLTRWYSSGTQMPSEVECRTLGGTGVTCSILGQASNYLQVKITAGSTPVTRTVELWRWLLEPDNDPEELSLSHTVVIVEDTTYPAPPPPPPPPASTNLVVDYGYNNQDSQLLDRCAVSCFAVVAGHSTVPYFSADAPRSVSLVYHGDRLAVRPFVYADVRLASGAPAATELWLEAKVNGSAVTFTNGDQRLRFSGAGASSGTVRLAGQFDASALATGAYPMTLTVGGAYANNTADQQTLTTTLVVANERTSPVARGWTIAGVPRLHVQSDGALVHTDGTGSALRFANCGSNCFTSPSGDFSRITMTGTGSGRTFTRAFVDSTKVRFDNSGRATSITDRFGNTVIFGYDAAGRLTSITDPVRRTPANQPSATVLTYGSYGLSKIQEPGADGTSGAGRSTLYTVASDSTLRVAKDPDGDSTRFGYDGSRRLNTVTDRRGQTTTFTYAASWKLASVQAPAITVGQSTLASPTATAQAWQAAGVPTTSTASALFAPPMRDTVRGHVTDPRGALVRFTADQWGQPLSITDPLGQVTTITRSGLFPVTVTYPAGGVDSTTYTGQFLTSSRSAGGPRRTYTYGAYGQLVQVQVNGVVTSQNNLSTNGTQVASTQVPTVGGGGSVSWALGYDTRGQVSTVTNSVFGTTQYTRDNRTGNVAQMNAPGGRWTQRTQDAFGRDSVLRAVDESQRRLTYDLENRLTSQADSTSSGWRTTTQAYNPLDLVRFKDAGNSVHRFGVNPVGWRTRIFDPADTLSRFQGLEYDAGGLVTAATNRRGQRRTFAYDVLGRLVARTAPTGGGAAVDSFAVSANGRVTAAWNGIARDSQFFSPNGWRDSAVTHLDGTRYLRTYLPDANGRLSQVAVSATKNGSTQQLATRSYTTDASTGLLTGISFARPNDPSGQSGQIVPEYDASNRRTAVNYYGPAQTLVSRRTDALTRAGRSYETTIGSMTRRFGYDSAGRIVYNGFVLPSGVQDGWRYSYDPSGHLATADTVLSAALLLGSSDLYGYMVGGSWQGRVSHTYDAGGNRTSPGGLTYTAGNRASGTSYDLDGNISSIGGWQLHWGASGLIDSAKTANRVVRYAYDASGRLVRRAVDTLAYNPVLAQQSWVSLPVMWLVWDGNQLIERVVGNITVDVLHAGGTDRPTATYDGTNVRFLHQDEMGGVFGATAQGGQETPYRYDAWGTPIGTSAPGAMDAGWKGMLWEPELGIYYARNRWYQPSTGRFLSEDPLHLAGGDNLYVFAGNSPITGADPFGLQGCDATRFKAEDGWVTVRVDGQEWCTNLGGKGQALPTVVVTAPVLPISLPTWAPSTPAGPLPGPRIGPAGPSPANGSPTISAAPGVDDQLACFNAIVASAGAIIQDGAVLTAGVMAAQGLVGAAAFTAFARGVIGATLGVEGGATLGANLFGFATNMGQNALTFRITSWATNSLPKLIEFGKGFIPIVNALGALETMQKRCELM